MPKLRLTRTYCFAGVDYGPGDAVEVPDKHNTTDGGGEKTVLSPFKEIQEKEFAYQQHLADGGEPVAPITPSLMPVTGEPENAQSLAKPSQQKAAAKVQNVTIPPKSQTGAQTGGDASTSQEQSEEHSSAPGKPKA